jgi:predicted Zn-dependent protease
MGGTASAAQGQLNFSRDMEREADRLGFAVMTNAGFEAQGVVSMFQKLAQASRLNDSGGFPYLRSHPLSTERIGDMQSRIGANATSTQSTPGNLEHAFMAGRARALMSTRAEEVESLVKAYENMAAADAPSLRMAGLMYAVSMAYTQQRQDVKARAVVRHLLALSASDAAGLRAVRWLAADTELKLGNPQACLTYLKEALVERPDMLLQMQCKLAVKDKVLTQQVIEKTQLWLAQFPRDPLAWDLAAQAYLQNGMSLQAIRADAESRAVRWDEIAAIDRLRAGHELARKLNQQGQLDLAGQQEATIIDTRLRALEKIRIELLRPQNN